MTTHHIYYATNVENELTYQPCCSCKWKGVPIHAKHGRLPYWDAEYQALQHIYGRKPAT